MRCLGIDYGEKRVGLSYSDELDVPVPIDPLMRTTEEALFSDLSQLIQQRKITDLVVGYPYNMDGSIGFKAQEVDVFIMLLEEHFHLPVHRVDERLTSSQAAADSAAIGRKKDKSIQAKRKARKTGRLDSQAATLILQDFLEERGAL